jgi:hypothetical protein
MPPDYTYYNDPGQLLLEGIPPELLQELRIPQSNILSAQIVDIIIKAGGTLSLNGLLIEVWKATGKVHTRQSLGVKLMRMVDKGLIQSVGGKKGIYAAVAKPPAESHTVAEGTIQVGDTVTGVIEGTIVSVATADPDAESTEESPPMSLDEREPTEPEPEPSTETEEDEELSAPAILTRNRARRRA